MDDVQQRQFDVLKQRLDLDIDFPTRSLRGSTEITIQPLVKDLRFIPLYSRQCRPTLIQVGGITAKWEHDDLYRRAHMSAKSTVHQHGMLKSRIVATLRPTPAPQLTIALPPKLKIQELHVDPATALPLYNATPSLQKQESDAMAIVETPIVEKLQQQIPQFAPIKLTIEFEVDGFRDGLHWIGCEVGDKRFPYLYTKLEPWPGNTSSIFPCVDDETSRCTWEIAVRCPRTLGDAFRKPRLDPHALPNGHTNPSQNGDVTMVNGIDTASKGNSVDKPVDDYFIDLNEDDAALELTVLCVGEPVDDIADAEDETRHTVTFNLDSAVVARHVGFAVGPFESVDLTAFRGSDEEEKLKDTAVKVHGYCLPGRAEELDNTCFPICQAVDFISVNYGRFPFKTYEMLFVDDAIYDTAAGAGMSICSTRLLIPQDIIKPLDANTRILVRAVADQYSGVNVIPKEPEDAWVIAGIAGYLTDVFMKTLAGNNQYRWEQKQASERVYDLDVDRPSIHQLGHLLHLDPSIRDFLNLKSSLVLGILDRRLVKSSGSTGCLRIVSKIFLNAKTGTLSNGELSTQDFQRTCEKLGHNKLESFFRQWVFGSGCPIFQCSQRFNKKKLVVEMTITQRQLERQTKPAFEPGNFMREIKEYVQEVWAPEPQTVFTGPMTIRIHEADGTPYEHIVEIKEPITKLEIPYNTKYKRLKRSRRQKERAMAEGNADGEGDGALLYCLGDILDTPEEMADWRLAEWTKEDEDKMGQESYEWIRMDADFEWIGKIHLVMPLYMYISQLQQDRDIVAQYESMRYLLGSNPHHVSLSILLRTLMDERYFYGIRVMAAEGIAKLSKDRLMETGQFHLMKAFTEMFCENEIMPRPNDFSSRVTFIMQCAIPIAMAQLRDEEGKVPKPVRQFFVDKLKFNDNSDNAYSDCHYIATLMNCLADSLVASHRIIQPQVEQTYTFSFGEEEPEAEETDEPFNPDAEFEMMAVNEIERYRRIDEWILTYQNIYSTTAIECLQKLTKAGIVKDKTKELLQYTRRSTADNVRLQAFRCLNEIGMSRRMPMMKHLLYSLADDRSPYFRERLLRLFGEALGHIALGDEETEKPQAPPPPTDGLVLEEGTSNETRRIEATRKTTPEGALAALKVILQDEETFKRALWYAATSHNIALDEVVAFCEIAALLYPSKDALTVTLGLPRPYKCQHQGRGKMRFYQEGKYRTTPSKALSLEDYDILVSFSLRYSGPLSGETEKEIARRKEEESIKMKIDETKLQLYAAKESQPIQIPQFMPPPPTVATPIEPKSGFKLSLGNPQKRKASVDLGAREGSPKIPKTSKASTHTVGTPKIAKKPSQASKQSRPIILRLSSTGARRAQEILSSPPQHASARSPSIPLIQQAKSRSQTPSSSLPQPSSLLAKSPTGSSVFSPPGLTSFTASSTLNPGGFRSFGTADTAPMPSFTQSPIGESPLATSPQSSPPAPPSLTSLTSMSPPATGEMAPPKKKLTLKLGIKRPEVD